MKECVKLEHAPEVSKEVLEKHRVAMEEIHEAICEINRRRIEDNKSHIQVLFERILKKGDKK